MCVLMMIKMIKFKSKLYQLILIIIIVISVSAVVVVVGCCCGCVGTAFLTVPSPCFASYIFVFLFFKHFTTILTYFFHIHIPRARLLAHTFLIVSIHSSIHTRFTCAAVAIFCFVLFVLLLHLSSLLSYLSVCFCLSCSLFFVNFICFSSFLLLLATFFSFN